MCQHYAHGTFQGGYPLLVPAVMRRMKRLVGLIPFLYVSSPKAVVPSSVAHSFIEIYADRVEVMSQGSLPRGLSLADLGSKSVRRNALLVDLLHRIDFIEKAGTGIRRIRDEPRTQGCPEPEFEVNGFFTATFRPSPEVRSKADVQSAEEVTTEVRLLQAISGEMTRRGLRAALGLKNDEHFRRAYLLPALHAGLIERTIPDKPRSRNQRYRLTLMGREFLKQTTES